MFEYLVPNWWNCVGGLGVWPSGGDMSLPPGFEISKSMPFPVSFLRLMFIN